MTPNKLYIRTDDGARRKALAVSIGGEQPSSVYVIEDPEDGVSDVGDLLAIGPVKTNDDGTFTLGPSEVVSYYYEEPIEFEDNAASALIPPVTLGRLLSFWPTSAWLPGPYSLAGEDVLRDPRTGDPVGDADKATETEAA